MSEKEQGEPKVVSSQTIDLTERSRTTPEDRSMFRVPSFCQTFVCLVDTLKEHELIIRLSCVVDTVSALLSA